MKNLIFKPIVLLALLCTIGALSIFSCQKDIEAVQPKQDTQLDLTLETRDIKDCDKVKEIWPLE